MISTAWCSRWRRPRRPADTARRQRNLSEEPRCVLAVRARLPGLILVTGALVMEWRTRQQGSRISSPLAAMDAGQRLLSMTSVLVREDKTSSLFRKIHGQEIVRTRTRHFLC